jgi:hypothetical protein
MKGERIQDKLLAWFADIRIYWGGIILFGDSHYKIKGPHTREIMEVLKPGDVLLRRYDHYLGSLLLKGYWSHAAIYVGDNQVIHMLGEGITKEDILTFCRTDDVCILRCADSDRVQKAIDEANRQFSMGTKYDYDFSMSTKKLYCSELVHHVYGGFSYAKRIGRFVYPEDIRYAHDLIQVWNRKDKRTLYTQL